MTHRIAAISCGTSIVALAVGVLLAAQAVLPAAAQAQVFHAVLVHGDGIGQPVLVDDRRIASCAWVYTYNLYSELAAQTPQPGPAITLSFFSVLDWERIVEHESHPVDSLTAARATFHTRLILSPTGGLPHVQFKKPWDADFVSRMTLESLAEPWLAALRIPTRVDASGNPVVREFSADRLEEVESTLKESVFAHCAVRPPER